MLGSSWIERIPAVPRATLFAVSSWLCVSTTPTRRTLPFVEMTIISSPFKAAFFSKAALRPVVTSASAGLAVVALNIPGSAAMPVSGALLQLAIKIMVIALDQFPAHRCSWHLHLQKSLRLTPPFFRRKRLPFYVPNYFERGRFSALSGADSLPARSSLTAMATALATLRTSACTFLSASSASWLVA